mmetsp:Transcript_20390/g.50148  ORF Transcript_20390/g.50148 Transcript_20390/m.50148 type:complete len:246 (-) Transcript_20390:290-1027(-)
MSSYSQPSQSIFSKSTEGTLGADKPALRSSVPNVSEGTVILWKPLLRTPVRAAARRTWSGSSGPPWKSFLLKVPSVPSTFSMWAFIERTPITKDTLRPSVVIALLMSVTPHAPRGASIGSSGIPFSCRFHLWKRNVSGLGSMLMTRMHLGRFSTIAATLTMPMLPPRSTIVVPDGISFPTPYPSHNFERISESTLENRSLPLMWNVMLCLHLPHVETVEVPRIALSSRSGERVSSAHALKWVGRI